MELILIGTSCIVGLFLILMLYRIGLYNYNKQGERKVKYKVKDCDYVPSVSSSGSGIDTDGDVVFTSSTTTEKFSVLLQNSETGKLKRMDCEELYSLVEKGNLVNLVYAYGIKTNKITNNVSKYEKLERYELA